MPLKLCLQKNTYLIISLFLPKKSGEQRRCPWAREPNFGSNERRVCEIYATLQWEVTFGRDIWAVMPKHDLKRVVGLCWLQRTFRLSIFRTFYAEEVITPFYLKCLWNFTVKYIIPIKWVHPTLLKRITINSMALDPQPRLGIKAFSVLRNRPCTLSESCSFFLRRDDHRIVLILWHFFSCFFILVIFIYVYSQALPNFFHLF